MIRRLFIGSVWFYFALILIGPILYLAVQSFDEGIAAFWREVTTP